MSNIKEQIKKAIATYQAFNTYKHYRDQFKRYLHQLGIDNVPAEGEDAYVQKWSVFNKRVEPYSYRLFSRFMGADPCIVPEDIGHVFIEDVLNPRRFRAYYSDKNLFDTTFKASVMPATILRRIGGSAILDKDFQIVRGEVKQWLPNDADRLILKPSIDSCSGMGVTLFVRNGNNFVDSKTGETLDEAYLMGYGNDFILQAALKQSAYISQFCDTSINTLRLAVYRSVTDEQIHVTAAIMRIGKSGSFIDNAHGGGRFVGIDLHTGELGKCVLDQYGNKSPEWNNIDFETQRFYIPNWEGVIKFAQYIGSCNHHCRLLALDIALDENNVPRLIEYNVDGFGFWVFMYSGQRPFGVYSDEIIEHCLKHKNDKIYIRLV